MNRVCAVPVAALIMLLFFSAAYAETHSGHSSVTPATGPLNEPFADNDFYDPFGDDDFDAPAEIADPLQTFNRAVFYFNDKVYFYALKPVAQTYSAVVPEGARKSVRNFFANLRTPVPLINCLLQGNVNGAATELSRFLVNSTLGVGGLFDPAATRYAMHPSRTNADRTFRHYGADTGIYLVLPFLGPSSIRGSAGLVMDACMNPLWLVEITVWERMSIVACEAVNDTSLEIGLYEDLKKAAVDPYLALRNIYVQLSQQP
jgi:phospholipid-binding lipoprotein MlaA